MYIFKFKSIAGIHESTSISINDDLDHLLYADPFLTFELNSMNVRLFYCKNFNDDYLNIDELIEICNSGTLIIEDDNLKNSSYLSINHEIGILLNDDVALYFKMKYDKVNFKLEEV